MNVAPTRIAWIHEGLEDEAAGMGGADLDFQALMSRPGKHFSPLKTTTGGLLWIFLPSALAITSGGPG
jgi:hypothetical protein